MRTYFDQPFTSGRPSRRTCRSWKPKRTDTTSSGMPDFMECVLDSKGRSETIRSEYFRRWGFESYPMEGDIEIARTHNANCHPQLVAMLGQICTRRGRGGRNLTARFMSARGHALRMIVHGASTRFRLRCALEPLGSHFLLWGHSHGMSGHSTHVRIGPHGGFAIV